MKKKTTKNKAVIIGLAIVALLAVGGAAYVKSSQPTATNKPSTSQENQEKDAEFNPKTDTEAAQRRAQSSPPPAASTAPPPSSQIAKPTITRAEQGAEGTVSVAAIVGQTSNGTCTAIFTKGQASFSRTTSVQQVTNYYACGEFRVPRSDFPAVGEWAVTVVLTSGNAKAASDTAKFVVN